MITIVLLLLALFAFISILGVLLGSLFDDDDD
jgi:hypothetical protein